MIDLHVHSTASDGTFEPEKLAHSGRNFTVMALTDHDNTDGVGETALLLDASGLTQEQIEAVENYIVK